MSIAATRPRASAMRLSGDATLRRRRRNDGSKPPLLLLLLLEDEASVDVVDDESSSTPPPPPPFRRRSDGNLLPRFLPWDDARELSSEREGPRLLRFVVPSGEDMSLSFGRRGGGPGGDDGDSQFLDPLFTILVVASSWWAWSSIVTSLVVSSSISAIGEEEEMVVVLRPPLLFPRKNSLGVLNFIIVLGRQQRGSPACHLVQKEMVPSLADIIWYLLWPTAPGRPWKNVISEPRELP